MIEKTAGVGLLAVTGIISAVGVLMFLLPPVPGVPVYLTLGIVLAAQGHGDLGRPQCFIAPASAPRPSPFSRILSQDGPVLFCTQRPWGWL